MGFAAGSALCGLAWDLESIVVFRVVQAIPGGILPVVTLTILYRIVPPERLGAAMGMYGLGIVVAPAIGPTLGGYLVEYVDWRLIFLINVPVGIVGTIAAVLFLPHFGPQPDGAVRLARLRRRRHRPGEPPVGADGGPDLGLDLLPRSSSCSPSALVFLALFVIIELEVDHPLLDVRVFRHWAYTNSLLLISVLSVGLFAVLFYIPLLLQQARGLGAFDTGLLLLPQALVMGVLMPSAGISTTSSARAGPPRSGWR